MCTLDATGPPVSFDHGRKHRLVSVIDFVPIAIIGACLEPARLAVLNQLSLDKPIVVGDVGVQPSRGEAAAVVLMKHLQREAWLGALPNRSECVQAGPSTCRVKRPRRVLLSSSCARPEDMAAAQPLSDGADSCGRTVQPQRLLPF